MMGSLFVSVHQVNAAPGLYAGCEGRIVRTSDGKEIDFSSLATELAKAKFVLFGERHGIVEHAKASACALSAITTNNRPAALVMEMLSVSDQSTIDAWRTKHPESASGLGRELEWWKRSWPAHTNWLPLIDRAFSLRTPLKGGDLGQKDQTPRPLSAKEKDQLHVRVGNALEDVQSSWRKAMTEAHCGLLSDDEDADQMSLHQIRRDLSMADIALKAADNKASVLLHVGRGHARKDRSLFVVLNERSKRNTISIGAFATTEEIKPRDSALHDYLWVRGNAPSLRNPCNLLDQASKEENQ